MPLASYCSRGHGLDMLLAAVAGRRRTAVSVGVLVVEQMRWLEVDKHRPKRRAMLG
jgi:hypothetical protein